MYRHINNHIEPILAVLRNENLVPDYDSLMCAFRNTDVATDEEFQIRYATFWGFHPGASPEWRTEYFRLLQRIRRNGSTPDLEQICNQTRGTRRDTPSVEFSFATKLVHMVDPESPIYDRNVRAFYLLKDPNGKPDTRVAYCLQVYDHLVTEYERIRKQHLLDKSIKCFQRELQPRTFTDVKIIDSLIWAFVKWAGPAFLAGELHYE